MSGRTTKLLVPLLISVFAAVARAKMRLPAIVGDNMVLQQGMKVRIWGEANAGENVTVTFDKKSASAVADAGTLAGLDWSFK